MQINICAKLVLSLGLSPENNRTELDNNKAGKKSIFSHFEEVIYDICCFWAYKKSLRFVTDSTIQLHFDDLKTDDS